MTSTTMMLGLIVVYVLTSIVSGFEGNWPRCFYSGSNGPRRYG